MYEFSVVFSGPQGWTELDSTIKMSLSVSVFKKSFRQQLLLKYSMLKLIC